MRFAAYDAPTIRWMYTSAYSELWVKWAGCPVCGHFLPFAPNELLGGNGGQCDRDEMCQDVPYRSAARRCQGVYLEASSSLASVIWSTLRVGGTEALFQLPITWDPCDGWGLFARCAPELQCAGADLQEAVSEAP